jgi:hypothetical protein
MPNAQIQIGPWRIPMTSLKKTVVLACAASVLSFGVAMAQTDPNAAAPDAGAAAAPMSSDQGGGAMPKKSMKKHMSKKHMSKKHMKKM